MKNFFFALIVILATIANVSAASIADYILMMMPAKEVNVNNMDYQLGMAKLGWFMDTKGGWLEKNEECKATAKLYHEGKLLGEVSAAAKDEEPYSSVVIVTATMQDNGDDLLPSANSFLVGFQFGFNPITAEGTYKLVVPDGFFMLDGKPLDGCEKEYHISTLYTTDPLSGSVDAPKESANYFSVTFLGVRSVQEGHKKDKWGFDYRSAKMHVYFNDEEVTDRFEYILPEGGGTVIFKAKEGMELEGVGTLRLTLDSGWFLTGRDDDPSVPVDFYFTTVQPTGDEQTMLEMISEEAEWVRVYDFHGRLIIHGPRYALRDLPSGLYIINGQKVLFQNPEYIYRGTSF